MKKVLIFLFPFCLSLQIQAQDSEKDWVDSVYNSLSLDQQIGQLFMVAAYSNRGEEHFKKLDVLIQDQGIGGLIFFQGGPMREAVLTNRYQSKAKVPLFMAIDGEWGLGMRLDSTMSFPYQMTLGAIQNKKLIYEMGVEVANHCKRIGLHINFAPVIDVNVNPNNPVISFRSFGENKEEVAERALQYMKGLQENGILANAKHFPGHGDTDADSHMALPVINHSVERIKEVELYPFRKLFEQGLMSLMVAHIHIPALDNRHNIATTLSYNVVTKLLKEEMGFKGLVFTDALNMKGVSKYYKPGEVDLLAFLAGNDVLLFPEDVPRAIAKIKNAIELKKVTKKDLENRVKKILGAKHWAGLHEYKPVILNGLSEDLHSEEAIALNYQLFQEAITIPKDEKNLIPLDRIKNIASVEIGVMSKTVFQEHLALHVKVDNYNYAKNKAISSTVINQLAKYETVIIGVHNTRGYGSFGITNYTKDFVKMLSKKTNVILVLYANVYALKYFQNQTQVICAYQDNDYANRAAAQALLGLVKVNGKLPVTVGKYKLGDGEDNQPIQAQISFVNPRQKGFDATMLNRIDTIVTNAIANKAMPGAQVLVMRGDDIVYAKAFGYQDYKKTLPIDLNTIYDLASITKVAAPTQLLMYYAGKGLIDLDKTVGYYLPMAKGTNKEGMTLRRVMLHQAGLKSWIPFWKKFVKRKGKLDDEFFAYNKTEKYSVRVSDKLYAIPEVRDSVFKWILESPVQETSKETNDYRYVYSDLGYYLIQKIIETKFGEGIDKLADSLFYKPMSLQTITYNPLNKFSKKRIAPTENDRFFRKGLIQGDVHDPGSAMIGGVAGHAGLFSNAFDLAKLVRMNLNHGKFNQTRILNDTIVPYFTKQQLIGNKRGIGWDKPEPQGRGGTAERASTLAYGHSGFTGTCVWVDPTYDLVYVFLSNRVYPDASNKKLIRTDVRTRIQEEIYKALIQPNVNLFD